MNPMSLNAFNQGHNAPQTTDTAVHMLLLQAGILLYYIVV